MKQPPRRETERRIDRRGNKRTSETEELNGKCDAGGKSGEKRDETKAQPWKVR